MYNLWISRFLFFAKKWLIHYAQGYGSLYGIVSDLKIVSIHWLRSRHWRFLMAKSASFKKSMGFLEHFGITGMHQFGAKCLSLDFSGKRNNHKPKG